MKSLTLFLCPYCKLWTYFAYCSGVYIVDSKISIAGFEQVNAGWGYAPETQTNNILKKTPKVIRWKRYGGGRYTFCTCLLEQIYFFDMFNGCQKTQASHDS